MEDDSRITVDVPFDMAEEFRTLIPWGMRKAILRSVFSALLEAMKEDRISIITAAVSDGFILTVKEKV